MLECKTWPRCLIRYSKNLYHEVTMKRNTFITLIVAALCLSWVMAAQSEEFTRESYVKSVITVLRIHANAIQNLTKHKIKYSDNLVRHAVAIRRTFGLLGPMDWHAAESAKLMHKEASNSDMDAEKFRKLEKNSRNAIDALVFAAHQAMVEDNREGLNEALENVKESCNACHSYMPASVAPDVWGTLKRR